MAISYQSIVDAIDAAVLAWAGEPVSLSIAGRSVTYRSLADLLAAREQYAALAAATGSGRGFRLTQIRPAGAI